MGALVGKTYQEEQAIQVECAAASVTIGPPEAKDVSYRVPDRFSDPALAYGD